MNVNLPNMVVITSEEFESMNSKRRDRVKYDLSSAFEFVDGSWAFYFDGITYKQLAVETCIAAGLKVE